MGVRGSWIRLSLALVFLLSACAGPPPAPSGIATRPVDPAFLHGTDGSRIDQLAATVVTEAQRYWTREYPASFGTAWRNLDGGFFSVNTTRSAGQPPPCSADTAEVEGNAYYCATVDAIAWDRSALLPVLREHYGEGAVLAVLAHELGHAVQQRTGEDTSGDPVRVEAMADCYAGSFSRWVADGHSDRLRLDSGQLDGALRALLVFRDPVGTARSSAGAHGSAFDRVTAFADGFRHGPTACSTAGSPARTDRAERRRPLAEVLGSAEMRDYFADLAGGRELPKPANHGAECGQPTAAYCAGRVVIDRDALSAVHYDLGDQASATLLASRYGLAALDARGQATTGRAAQRQVTCLTGAYTGSRVDGPLSAADLDAAVATLLANDGVSRDASGSSALAGLDRVAAFRSGFVGGPATCGE